MENHRTGRIDAMTENLSIPGSDVVKLHEESLQLRNQQFMIGTVALTGSGLVLGVSALYQSDSGIPGQLFALFVWLCMLFYLFLWSLSLRRLITTISTYLQMARIGGERASHWEQWYLEFSREQRDSISPTHPKGWIDTVSEKIYATSGSQTNIIQGAFIAYGTAACVINGLNFYFACRSNACVGGSLASTLIVLAMFVVYIVSLVLLRRTFDRLDARARHEIAESSTAPSVEPMNPVDS